jgi:hypothetical protein
MSHLCPAREPTQMAHVECMAFGEREAPSLVALTSARHPRARPGPASTGPTTRKKKKPRLGQRGSLTKSSRKSPWGDLLQLSLVLSDIAIRGIPW